MSPLEVRSNGQRLVDEAAFQQKQMWRAAETVRRRTPDATEREELLACLGLTDVQPPGTA
jgi:hypothetical protein